MPAILPGYTYDIFISYRQKDNKYDGWVTEFVDHLKRELEATFKEDISVYFDENPHDGLRETHIVDRSLKEKLKCLIFIPIISGTYCDPNSFAWQHEFIAFNNLAKEDPLGREVKLSSGNFASRILPVKINDIDAEDKNEIEGVLGGIMRPVEFIYRSAGVNRPLKPDDLRSENLNHTYYRDQINKVANAIKEIVVALKSPGREKSKPVAASAIQEKSIPEKSKKIKPKFALWIIIAISLGVSGYLLVPELSKTSTDDLAKSIAVLPFENMSNDPEQDYFCDGIMQEIRDKLFMIGGINIPAGTSTMRFKGSKLSVSEIARELGVKYILEGNVYKVVDSIKIIIELVDGRNENVLWTGNYRRAMNASNLFEIHSEIAQKVAASMKVVIIPEVKRRIEAKPTLNIEAYTLYMQALRQVPLNDVSRSKLERAIALDSGYADAYALLAGYWLYKGGFNGNLEREQVLKNAEPLIEKSLQLDQNSVMAHTSKARLSLYYRWDFESVENELNICIRLLPSNTELEGFFIDFLLSSGENKRAMELSRRAFINNKESMVNWINMSLSYYFNEVPDSALKNLETINRLFQENTLALANIIRLNNYLGNYNTVLFILENHKQTIKEGMSSLKLGHFGIACYKTGNKSKAIEYLHELISRTDKSSVGSPSFYTAALYTAMGEKDKAIQYLQKAYANHEVEMYWLKVEPLFRPLHGDPKFEEILKKIGFK